MKILFIFWGILGLFKTASALSPNVRATSSVPEEGSDGLCYDYVVQFSDTCQCIASEYGITKALIEKYNSDTWGWTSCSDIYQGDIICLSSGEPPMPMALPVAICGPQVPGTARPKNYADLSSLNPCATGYVSSFLLYGLHPPTSFQPLNSFLCLVYHHRWMCYSRRRRLGFV